jgi:hypothetical protein
MRIGSVGFAECAQTYLNCLVLSSTVHNYELQQAFSGNKAERLVDGQAPPTTTVGYHGGKMGLASCLPGSCHLKL